MDAYTDDQLGLMDHLGIREFFFMRHCIGGCFALKLIEQYLHNLYRMRLDFVCSLSRDFARSIRTRILVLPDDTPAHPHQTSVDIASPCPNAEVTVYPWREPRS